RSSTRAWRYRSSRCVTWMPAARNGGHRLIPWRNRLAFIGPGQAGGSPSLPYGGVLSSGSEQQGRHPAPIGADQRRIVDDPESVDQRLARQAIVEVAVLAQHLDE